MASQVEQPHYPWSDTSPIKGNLAIGNLRENLQRLLTDDRGIHAETLLASIGAIAGYASQNAFWHQTGLHPTTAPERIGDQLVVVRLHSGERLFYGDGINSYLAGGPGDTEKLFLWGFVQGALLQLEIPLDRHPDLNAMFARVTKVAGTDAFGMPDVPVNHRPKVPVVQLIKELWPSVENIFKFAPPRGVAATEADIGEAYWPFVSFIVASQFIQLAGPYVPPDVTATLVMESAIAASKLDPLRLFPGSNPKSDRAA